jgi:PIN domain nuclease of toxin-antitoxin system
VLNVFESARADQSTIYVSSYVFVEIAQLLRKNVIKLNQPLSVWTKTLFTCRGYRLVPIDLPIVLEYESLLFSKDPADSLIVATAINLDLPLITNDSLIHKAAPCKLFWD